MTINGVSRPALRYFGGKWRIAPWIIRQFPDHLTYVEPFGGGMSVLLRKKPSYNEVYNDLDSEVVNFFMVLRERYDELIRTIELTPYSREEQRLSFVPATDPLERARRLYVRSWQTHGGARTQWSSGWRYEKSDSRGSRLIDDWKNTKHLWQIVERLKGVQIEHDDAMNLIPRFDRQDTLFFLDPPYVPSTRSVRWRDRSYVHEYSNEQHVEMISRLKNIKGMAILCGYPNELYDSLLTGWHTEHKYTITNYQKRVTECLWINPAAMEGQQQKQFKFKTVKEQEILCRN